ncbi:lymphoid-restricted membrane protein [Gouania willdenowi]|uniref:lymphoid-restricted membrane protein n=1 Tax=Gouania willdenowi TaxID=441366 RepID=UPI00105658EF|nr:lymphoid-restricted membrane protein-like [Gouania willdenowi]
MNAEPEAETSQSSTLLPMLDSEDSDEEEHPVTSWSELSIIERVGLNSVEVSEKDLETTFSQIALAFRCDQYTLKQRLQAEEHARNLAEENIQLELTRGRETLETLKDLCLDSKRSSILQRLELSLDILGGTVERISNTAEVLGAVHQEARVSRAVELMVAHVESLRRRYDRNAAELEEARKTLQHQQNSFRGKSEHNAGSDPEDNENRTKCFPQNSLRRRVSISLITNQTQEKKKQDSKSSCCTVNREDISVEDRWNTLSCFVLSLDYFGPKLCFFFSSVNPEETPSEAPSDHLPKVSPAAPNPTSIPSKQLTVRKTQNKK